ncbi:MAG: phosphopentomutase [Alphaproteobacteria bacterium]|nr:phosphopentomutase [Alphaproteobacteria bacterium]
MSRAIILVLDSLGIGASTDAAGFGDAGADTLGHIAQACAAGRADGHGRSGPLAVPNLVRLGLGMAAMESSGRPLPGLDTLTPPEGAWGYAVEQSRGKDTPSGHWEIAGLPVPFDWYYFPREKPSFPPDLIAALVARCGLPGILGDCHASGTEIIRELGAEHIRTGRPICYTSADSVFQIAAHEEHFGLERLYAVCEAARELVDKLNVGRVIARPFTGEDAEGFTRTANRRDYTTPPFADTLLDRAAAAGREVVSVGKVADIFGGRGITRTVKAGGNMALFDRLMQEVDEAPDGAIVFVNFVDFDTLYGHRRNIAGYAAALEEFDRRLPTLEYRLHPGDLVLMTADHGCDPSWPGSDHTREHVPVLFFGPAVRAGSLGRRGSFADMGQTIADHLGLGVLDHGVACAVT